MPFINHFKNPIKFNGHYFKWNFCFVHVQLSLSNILFCAFKMITLNCACTLTTIYLFACTYPNYAATFCCCNNIYLLSAIHMHGAWI